MIAIVGIRNSWSLTFTFNYLLPLLVVGMQGQEYENPLHHANLEVLVVSADEEDAHDEAVHNLLLLTTNLTPQAKI